MVVGSLVALVSGFRTEGSDAIKDPLSACGVRVHKICWSERPVVGR